MSWITDLTDLRLSVVDSGSTVQVHLNPRDSLIISTPLEAHALADELRRAANVLEEHARLDAARRDRVAARANEQQVRTAEHRLGRDLPATARPPSARHQRLRMRPRHALHRAPRRLVSASAWRSLLILLLVLALWAWVVLTLSGACSW